MVEDTKGLTRFTRFITMLRRIAAYCSLLQRVAARTIGNDSHLLNITRQIVAVYCSFAVCCSERDRERLSFIQDTQSLAHFFTMLQYVVVCCSTLQCVALCCSDLQCVVVLQCVAVARWRKGLGFTFVEHTESLTRFITMLQCVAVCCSVLQWRDGERLTFVEHTKSLARFIKLSLHV